jgi:hypothetical protein
LRRRIALSTRFDAAFPYLRPPDRFEELFRFAVAIGSPRIELAFGSAVNRGKKPAN